MAFSTTESAEEYMCENDSEGRGQWKDVISGKSGNITKSYQHLK